MFENFKAMDTDKAITSPEEQVDRALDILLHLNIFKNETEILKEIETRFGQAVPLTNLSRSKTLRLTRKGYVLRGEDFISSNKIQGIANLLTSLLKEIAYISFENEKFIHLKTGQTWGKLEPDTGVNIQDKPEILQYNPFVTKDLVEIFNEIKEARSVRVLHTYITAPELFKDCCVRAITDNDCKIQVMLLEPFSEALRLRAKGLSDNSPDGENVESKSKENYRLLKNLEKIYPENFSFITYNEMPGFTLYQIDLKMYVGFQWFQKFSYQGRFYMDIFDPQNIFHHDIDDHFNRLWNANLQKSFQHEYICYLLRNTEPRTMTLKFDINQGEVLMTNTPSQVDFEGYMVEQDGGISNVILHTKYSSFLKNPDVIGDKRYVNLMINFNRKTMGSHEDIFVGLYSVNTKLNQLRANVVVLVNKKAGALDGDKETIIWKFLEANHSVDNTSEINLNYAIHSWRDMKEFVKSKSKEL